jgi:putative Holliday junction resolvase
VTIAAIDYGKRRLGIAASDPLGILVYPAGVIQRRSLKYDLAVLSERLRELEASRVIVGLPLNMDGSVGEAARAAEQFARHVRDATGLEVELHDERLSTWEAEMRLKTGPKHSRRSIAVDAVAAVIILESWFQARRCAP